MSTHNIWQIIRLIINWGQADLSLCCLHEEALGPKLPSECTAKTQTLSLRLISLEY